MITLEMPWENVLLEMTTLPGTLQEEHGDSNFLRAGRYRRNARELWERGLLPVLRPLPAGYQVEVLLGFVDQILAHETGLDEVEGFVPGMTTFTAARLRLPTSGLIFDVAVSPAITHPVAV
jgi:hypothetical protein